MLALTGRKADGWLPSLSYLQPGDLPAGNARIDEAATRGRARPGRDPPAAQRRGLFSAGDGPLDGPPAQWVQELARMALEDGVGTFILSTDDPDAIATFAGEVAPVVREVVAEARAAAAPTTARAGLPRARGERAGPEAPPPRRGGAGSEYERLGVAPTPDDGTRVSGTPAWDEATRPHRDPSPADVDVQPSRPARRAST